MTFQHSNLTSRYIVSIVKDGPENSFVQIYSNSQSIPSSCLGKSWPRPKEGWWKSSQFNDVDNQEPTRVTVPFPGTAWFTKGLAESHWEGLTPETMLDRLFFSNSVWFLLSFSHQIRGTVGHWWTIR